MTDIAEIMARAMLQSLRDAKAGIAYTGYRVSTGEVDLESFARAALTALQESGYVVVPVVPTEEMQ
jgi:hypothetical protein